MIQKICRQAGASRRLIVVIVLVCTTLALIVEIRWIRNRTVMRERPIRQSSITFENSGITDVATTAEEPPPAPPADASLTELADYIRPRPSEERWATLGWRYNLREAMVLADQTNRMVFLWATNRPMGRC